VRPRAKSRLNLLVPVAWLLMSAALLPLLAGVGGQTSMIVAAATALAVGLFALLLASHGSATRETMITAPALRRLRGSFFQHTRPGVPGRVRARAPGCGH
jgi:hypothetical protein